MVAVRAAVVLSRVCAYLRQKVVTFFLSSIL